MKLLHVADLHAVWPWYEWLLGQAPNYDVTVIAGDLVNMLDDRTLWRQIRRVADWIEKFPGKLVVCSGDRHR